MKIRVAISALAITFLYGAPASSEVVIPGGELTPEDILATEPLLGIRNFPTQFIITDSKEQETAGIPTAVMDAAIARLQESEFKLAELPQNWKLYTSGVRASIVNEVLAANETRIIIEFEKKKGFENTTTANLSPKAPINEINDLKGKKIIMQAGIGVGGWGQEVTLGDGFAPVDALFLAALLRSELVAQPVSVVPTQVVNGYVDVVPLNSKVVQDFRVAYGIAETLPQLQVQFIPEQFARLRSSLEKHPELSKVALKILTNVSFGKPQIYPAKERNLNIPKSAQQYHDFYWADFAISNRSLDPDLIETLTFSITLKGNAIVTDLIPFVYGQTETREEMLSSPEAEISFGPARLRIGEMYRQTVTFESIRPQIRANGLFEPFFAWQLKGSAAKPGTSRFIAILKVPKSQQWLELKMSAMAKTKGILGFQSDLATTNEVPYTVRLR